MGACSNLCGGFPDCANINFSRAETAWRAVRCIVLRVIARIAQCLKYLNDYFCEDDY